MAVIGVTGSRNGTTRAQWATMTAALADVTARVDRGVLHHGGCVGVDEAVHRWCATDSIPWEVHVHPGDASQELKAECPNADNLKVVRHPPRTSRDRNADIVAACDVLVAAPDGLERERRYSGTWATVRLARKAGKPIRVVLPDGRVIREEN